MGDSHVSTVLVLEGILRAWQPALSDVEPRPSSSSMRLQPVFPLGAGPDRSLG